MVVRLHITPVGDGLTLRLRCRLREFRGKRPLREVATDAALNRGTLSLIELGRLLPTDEQVAPIERAYGVRFEDWYSPRALSVIEEDEAA